MIPPHITQLPVFTAAGVRRAGVSWHELERAVSAGEVARLKRGWFTAQPMPWPSDRHRLMVQVELTQRPGLVASHYSGALLLGLPVHTVDWSTVHLMRTSAGRALQRHGLVIHQHVPVAADLRLALVIAQTTLLCCTSGLMALDAALAADQVTKEQVEAAARQLAGRSGHSRLATVVRLGDARRESPLESWTALVYDGWGFRLQPQFQVPGTNYRADARIVGTRVLLESDGKQKYTESSVLMAEKVREDDLRARHWQVVRVTSDLLRQPELLLARTRSALLLAAR
jgi:very-short-patch-repair endonuclease